MDFNPGLLQNLLNADLADTRGHLLYTPRVLDALKVSLEESIFKKWIPDQVDVLEDRAIAGFLAANTRCADFILDRTPDYITSIINRAKIAINDIIYSGPLQTDVLTLDACLGNGRAGPGSSRCTKATNFYEKMFDGPLATTNTLLYHHYKTAISSRWLDAELHRAQLYQIDVVEGSSLSTVPKNAKTNRTICTEPALNMFYQLGAGFVFEKLLKRYHNIDMSLQPDRNREMARIGSINGTFATIDLQSASDTISNSIVSFLFPPSVRYTLDLLRSPTTKYKDQVINLNMISSMGNGFTFPLQTLIFASLVRATYDEMGITPLTRDDRNYSVFGDDIICLKEAYDTVCLVLERCGFIVNSEKSYNEGPFRESCGKDFYDGHDIRGVYLRKVYNEQDIYSTFNRLSRWSAKHNIDISRTLSYVKGLADFQPIPYDAGDDEGFKCPSRCLLSPLKRDRNGAQYYRAMIAIPASRRLPISDSLNLNGAIICAIGGYIRGNRVPLRISKKRVKVVTRKTPRWDFVSDAGLTIRDYEEVYENLSYLDIIA